MYCSNCGAEHADTAKFCTNCGQALKVEKPSQQIIRMSSTATLDKFGVVDLGDHMTGDSYEYDEDRRNNLSRATFALGLLGMVFSLLCIGPVGFILSIIAKSKAGKYLRAYGQEDDRVRSGRKMANAGFVVGLIISICWILYFFIIVLIVGVLTASGIL